MNPHEAYRAGGDDPLLANVLLLDSVGYVAQPGFRIQDARLVTGSHGGTSAAGYILEHPEKPQLALFNDAGGGKDEAGLSGLPQLQAVGVAAATYSHQSARIGSARDGLDHGVLSHCNEIARARGLRPGQSVREALGLPTPPPPREPDPLGPPLRRFKDPAYAPRAQNLAQVRAGIDALDEQIVALLAQRAMWVKDAARFKADHFQVSAPARQEEVFRRVRERAMQLNPGFEGFETVVEKAWRSLVAGFIAEESRYFNQMENL